MTYFSSLRDQELLDYTIDQDICDELSEEILKREHLYIPGKWFLKYLVNKNIIRKHEYIKRFLPRIDPDDEIFQTETVTLLIVMYGDYENILEFLKYPFSNVLEKFKNQTNYYYDYDYRYNGILYAAIKNKSISASEVRQLVEFLLQNHREIDPSEYLNNPFSNALTRYESEYDEPETRAEYFNIMKILLNDSRVTVTFIQSTFIQSKIKDHCGISSLRTKYDHPDIHYHAFIRACACPYDEDLIKLFYPKVFDPAISNSFALRAAVACNKEKIVRMLLDDPRIDPSALNSQVLHVAIHMWYAVNIRITALLMNDPRVDPTLPSIETKSEDYYSYAPLDSTLYGAMCSYNTHVVRILLCHPDIYTKSNHEELHGFVVKYSDCDEERRGTIKHLVKKIVRVLILRSNKKLMGYVYKELWCYRRFRKIVLQIQEEMIVRIQRWYHKQIKYCPGNSGFRKAQESFDKMISLRGR